MNTCVDPFLKMVYRKTWPVCLSAIALLTMTTAVMSSSVTYAQSVEAARVYNRGIDEYNKGNIPSALNLFQQATQMDNTYTDAFYNLGTVYFQQQQYDAAINAFERAAQLRKGDSQVLYNLALCYERKGNLARATDVLKQITPGDSKYQLAQSKIQRFVTVTQIPQNQEKVVSSNTATDPNFSAGTASLASMQPQKLPVETVANGFFGPTGITAGINGALFVANYSKNAIYKVSPNGNKEVFAQGNGLDGPVGLVFNPRNSEFYVANYLGNSIAKVNANGVITPMASGLKKPYYLYLDTPSNTLFVSEQETNTISRIKIN